MRTTTFLLVSLSLLIALGCSQADQDRRAEVSGAVRVNGEPLATGSITFRPTAGNDGPTAGGAIANGQYHVVRAKGVTLGKNQVVIQSTVKTGRQVGGSRGVLEDEQVQAIPARYNDQSEIVCDVQPGSNQLDFDLKVTPADGVPKGIFGAKK